MFHELFEGQQGLPYHIFLIDAETTNSQFHPEMEICFLLNGQAEFHVDEMVYPLYQHDFLIVNPLVLHRINSCSQNCRLLFLHIDLNAFQKYDPDMTLRGFAFTNSVNNRNQELYQTLYQGFRQILQLGIHQKPNWKLEALGEVIRILSALMANVQETAPPRLPTRHDNAGERRIHQILDYIDRHWQESFTMEELAREMHMSPSYFSRYFKSVMQVGFQKYLTSLRLNRSLPYLLNTDMPIVEIAVECGFNDYKTYGRLFRDAFGQSPNVYRKEQSAPKAVEAPEASLSSVQILNSIPPAGEAGTNRVLRSIDAEPEALPAQSVGLSDGPILSVGRASNLALASVQAQLVTANKQLGSRYVRLMVDACVEYQEESDSFAAHFYGARPDELLRFFQQNQLQPILQLAPLRSWQKDSKDFILSFLDKFYRRFANMPRLPQLILQLWDLPELPSQALYERPAVFFDLVRSVTELTLRNFPDASILAPATCGRGDYALFKQFASYCREQKLLFHSYPLNLYAFPDPLNASVPKELRICVSEFSDCGADAFAKRLQSFSRQLKNASSQRILLSAWPMTAYLKDYTRDTSSLPARMLQELSPLLPLCSGVICELSDLCGDAQQDATIEFHGGSGLLTRLGIPKPAYTMLSFVHRMGDVCLEVGDGYILTRRRSSLRLLLYYSSPYNTAFSEGQQELLFEEDRYNIYEDLPDCQYNIRLRIPDGRYRVETSRIDREHASPYDEWIRMGSPRRRFIQYEDYLKSRCIPELRTEKLNVRDHLRLEYVLPPHGVMLIEITPI